MSLINFSLYRFAENASIEGGGGRAFRREKKL